MVFAFYLFFGSLSPENNNVRPILFFRLFMRLQTLKCVNAGILRRISQRAREMASFLRSMRTFFLSEQWCSFHTSKHLLTQSHRSTSLSLYSPRHYLAFAFTLKWTAAESTRSLACDMRISLTSSDYKCAKKKFHHVLLSIEIFPPEKNVTGYRTHKNIV